MSVHRPEDVNRSEAVFFFYRRGGTELFSETLAAQVNPAVMEKAISDHNW